MWLWSLEVVDAVDGGVGGLVTVLVVRGGILVTLVADGGDVGRLVTVLVVGGGILVTLVVGGGGRGVDRPPKMHKITFSLLSMSRGHCQNKHRL